MVDPIIDCLRKATESTIQVQQEMLKKWSSLWTGVAGPAPILGDQVQKLQKAWAEFLEDALKRQREALEANFAAGRKNLESALKLTEAKDPQELRAKTVELWQQAFVTLRQACETQIRECQTAVGKWTEMLSRSVT